MILRFQKGLYGRFGVPRGAMRAGLIMLVSLLLPAGAPAGEDKTWVEIDGEIYGAKPDERGPIGGGEGYYDIITGGDYEAKTLEGLVDALEKAVEGEVVFVPAETEIDLTTFIYIRGFQLEIPGGVTLAGNRGHEGSKGALLINDYLGKAREQNVTILITGAGSRVTGLRIQGPNPRRRLDHHGRSFRGNGLGRDYYYKFPTQRGIQASHDGLRVDNCEIWGFGHTAVNLPAGEGHRVHHNFIHRNQHHGLGYGVTINRSRAFIEYNHFDYNRHSIAGTGRTGSGYTARHNVELGTASSHCFDMHGRYGQAGAVIEIYNNTFRAPQRAVAIRNSPEESCEIYRNWFVRHSTAEQAVRGSRGAAGLENLDIFDNAYTPFPEGPE